MLKKMLEKEPASTVKKSKLLSKNQL